jgi:hypothetical protein
MRNLIKYILLFLLLATLLGPISTLSAAGQKAVIISNQADLPAANYIKQLLSSAGISVTILHASDFESAKGTADVIIVLGGPDAYEGVGQISAKYLSSDDQQYLRSTKGSSVVRKFSDSGKEIIIIAGNTRSETKLSSEVYSQAGFPGSSLAASAAKIVARTGDKLTYRMVITDKKEGSTQTVMATVERFSGTMDGIAVNGMKWTYTMSYQGQTTQIEQISAYTPDGRFCTTMRTVVAGTSVVVSPWNCVQESQTSTPAGGGSISQILNQRISVETKTVPAGTFLCLKYELHDYKGGISRVWSSSQVPLTGLVAMEYEGSSSSVVIELVKIG